MNYVSFDTRQSAAVFTWNDTSSLTGNVMLVWSNPLGIWASRFE